MSAFVSAHPPLRMARLEKAETIQDVVRNVDQVIEWSIEAKSRIGYFAALYKRITLAIREAISEGVFDDGHRMAELDVAFAQRYFNALNAYFHPDEFKGLTLPWEVSFVGEQNDQAIILQQMMTAMNAHITFDLGLAALAVAGNALDTLANDFNRVNAVLASQIPGVLDVIQQLSPDLRRIRRVIPDEIGLTRRLLIKFRTGAWLFAVHMALYPGDMRQKRVNHAAWTAAVGAWYLQPPARLTPFPILVRVIAKRESRDVAANIRALETITTTPDKLNNAYL